MPELNMVSNDGVAMRVLSRNISRVLSIRFRFIN